MNRDLKPSFYLLLMLLPALLTLGSCSSKRGFPVSSHVNETVNTVERTIYRDTVITRTIPGDTVLVEMWLPGEVPDLQPVIARNEWCVATSWVTGGKQSISLVTLPRAFDFALQNKTQVRYVDRVKTVEQTRQVKHVPRWLFWLLAVLSVNLAFTVLRIKRTGSFF